VDPTGESVEDLGTLSLQILHQDDAAKPCLDSRPPTNRENSPTHTFVCCVTKTYVLPHLGGNKLAVLPPLHQSMKLGMWRGCRRMVWQDDRKCEFGETERNKISHHPCMLDDLAGVKRQNL
jgi:hypothetical protein